MDLSELHRVQRQERSTDSLQELRASFYADVAEYLESLRVERAKAAAEVEDPFRSARVRDLTNEIETAEHVAEAIYERRIGKLVDEASLEATGNGGDTSGLTDEEQDLYDDLVDLIADNKGSVLEQFRGNRSSPDSAAPDEFDGTQGTADSDASAGDEAMETEPAETPASGSEKTGSITEATASPADAMGPELDRTSGEKTDSETEDEPAEEPVVERTTIRMTTDVGEIFGVDAETYELGEDDIVDLPSENAAPLLDRDAAERVE